MTPNGLERTRVVAFCFHSGALGPAPLRPSVGRLSSPMANKRRIILISAACIGVLLACAVPFLTRAWSREATNACISNLRQIDGAKQAWAQEQHQGTNDVPTWADLLPIIYPGRRDPPFDFVCRKGGTYTIGRVGEAPRCSFPGHELPQ